MQTASSELLLNCISAVELRSVFSRSPQILQHLDDRLHLWIPAPASGDTSLPLPPISQNVPSRVESCLPVILRAMFLSCIYLPSYPLCVLLLPHQHPRIWEICRSSKGEQGRCLVRYLLPTGNQTPRCQVYSQMSYIYVVVLDGEGY